MKFIMISMKKTISIIELTSVYKGSSIRGGSKATLYGIVKQLNTAEKIITKSHLDLKLSFYLKTRVLSFLSVTIIFLGLDISGIPSG